MLAAERLAPELLQLEITESRALPSGRGATRVADELRAMGVSIAIDDFGTGFSSLVQLQRLPVDEIKIDRSFVATMAHNPSDAAIVRSTIDLARNLGLRVTAEGVETEEARAQLTEMGCELAQGYGLCRPVSADRCARVIRETGIAGGAGHERARCSSPAPRSLGAARAPPPPRRPPRPRRRSSCSRTATDAPARADRPARARPTASSSSTATTRVLDGFAADLTAGQVAALEAEPAVAFIEQDAVVAAAAGLSVPVAAGETVPPGIRRVGGVAGTLTRAAAAPVAVLDSGLDLANADLVARAGTNCVKPGTSPQDDSGPRDQRRRRHRRPQQRRRRHGRRPGHAPLRRQGAGQERLRHALPDPLRHQLGHGERRRAGHPRRQHEHHRRRRSTTAPAATPTATAGTRRSAPPPPPGSPG